MLLSQPANLPASKRLPAIISCPTEKKKLSRTVRLTGKPASQAASKQASSLACLPVCSSNKSCCFGEKSKR